MYMSKNSADFTVMKVHADLRTVVNLPSSKLVFLKKWQIHTCFTAIFARDRIRLAILFGFNFASNGYNLTSCTGPRLLLRRSTVSL